MRTFIPGGGLRYQPNRLRDAKKLVPTPCSAKFSANRVGGAGHQSAANRLLSLLCVGLDFSVNSKAPEEAGKLGWRPEDPLSILYHGGAKRISPKSGTPLQWRSLDEQLSTRTDGGRADLAG